MHRIAATPGGWNPQDEGVVFIEQTPAPFIVLTSADTDIQAIASASQRLPADFPALRVANLLHLQQQLTIDTYAEAVLESAQVILLRLLGGRAYWSYGLEVVQELSQRQGIALIVLPGDDRPDPELLSLSSLPLAAVNQIWRYFIEGGIENISHALQFMSDLCLSSQYKPPLPQVVPQVGRYEWVSGVGCRVSDGRGGFHQYDSGLETGSVNPPSRDFSSKVKSLVTDVGERNATGKVGILFYRAHYLAGNTAPIEALCEALAERQLNPIPVFVSSLRDPDVQTEVLEILQPKDEPAADVVLNTTSFAIAEINSSLPSPPLNSDSRLLAPSLWHQLNVPVLQVILSGGTVEQWQAQWRGLSPRDMAMNVALPEVDGRIISRAVSFKAVQTRNTTLETDVVTYEPVGDRIQFVADLAANWVNLRRTPPEKRKIALILANYPTRDGRLANGVGLDTPASCIEIIKALQAAGYQVKNPPQTSDELIQLLTAGITNDPEGYELRPVFQSVSGQEYQQYFANLSAAVQQGMGDRWGEGVGVKGEEDRGDKGDREDGEEFAIAGVQLGNVFVGIQPARGYDKDPLLNYHAPDLEPTHEYLAFYYWLREHFGAQAIVHIGKHGNLEWLPGKSIALSENCYPEVALGALPHLYPFIVNDPGEGAQAKRRSQAVILDHLTPPMTRAELYGPLQQLEGLIDEYYEAQNLDPSRLELLRERIANLIQQENLHRDLESRQQITEANQDEFIDSEVNVRTKSKDPLRSNFGNGRNDLEINQGGFIGEAANVERRTENPPLQDSLTTQNFSQLITTIDGYLCELKEAQIRDGLHIFGKCPEGRQLRDLVIAIARQPGQGRLGLTRAIAADWGLDFDPLTADPSQLLSDLAKSNSNLEDCKTIGDAIACIENYAIDLITPYIPSGDGMRAGLSSQSPNQVLAGKTRPYHPTSDTRHPTPDTPSSPDTRHPTPDLTWITNHLLPALLRTSEEITNLLSGLNGEYVPPGASGAPTRGRPEVLPTGRNFYSVDIRAIPTETAWDVGRKAAETLIERYTQEHGEYPKTLGLSVWGTSCMRTGGDDLAEALALLGVKPVWEGLARRVIDFEILPLLVLGRPRVDVTLRISGFFRDAFPNLIDLFDQAVAAIASLDEPEDQNPLAAQVRKETEHWQSIGLPEEKAEARSRYRIFGSKPGAYGAGLQGLIEAQNWTDDADLARAYINWSSYAYTRQSGQAGVGGVSAPEAFEQRLSQMQIVLHNQDNREHDLLDSDDYYQFQGGLTAAVRSVQGQQPVTYFGDHSQPANPKIRRLQEEIARVYRSRVINPKWIEGVMRHGYKGAFEMAATVDYLFAYDASAHCVEDFMYQGIAEAYVFDPTVQAFVQQKNPWALRDMAERLLEANQRGLWQEVNQETLDKLKAIVNEAEGAIEGRG